MKNPKPAKQSTEPPITPADPVEVQVLESEGVAYNKNGRPSKRQHDKIRFSIDWDVVEARIRAGASGKQVARQLGIDRRIFYRYVREQFKVKYFSDWQESLMEDTRHALRRAQIKEATGYHYDKIEIEMVWDEKQQKMVERKRKTIRIWHPPNPAIQIFLGKNMLQQGDQPQNPAGKFGEGKNMIVLGDETTDFGDSDEENEEEGEEGGHLLGAGEPEADE